jgi:HAD superfamily hydrolase (TIGR01509 family)
MGMIGLSRCDYGATGRSSGVLGMKSLAPRSAGWREGCAGLLRELRQRVGPAARSAHCLGVVRGAKFWLSRRSMGDRSPKDGLPTVVFDLGGVLVEIRPSLSAACRAAGLPVHPVLDEARIVGSWKELDGLYQTGCIGTDEYFERMSARLGAAYLPGEVAEIHRHWLGAEYPGVAELITELHQQSVPTGVLSNTNPSHLAILQGDEYTALRMLIRRHPERVHASHLLGLCKPDRAIYRAYTERTGLPPALLLFFDDSISNVLAARAEGWQAFLIDPEGDPAAQMRAMLAFLRPDQGPNNALPRLFHHSR